MPITNYDDGPKIGIAIVRIGQSIVRIRNGRARRDLVDAGARRGGPGLHSAAGSVRLLRGRRGFAADL
jgi:hypothetical protein